MEMIKNIFSLILMNDKGMLEMNKVDCKKLPFYFIGTNVILPLLMNIIFYFCRKLDFAYIQSCLYFIFWNIIINSVLLGALFLIFYIKKGNYINLLLHAVVFMNLIQPVMVLLGFFTNNIIINLFFIAYHVIFIMKYISINNQELERKKIQIYTFISCFILFIFLCLTENLYMLF